MIPYKQYFLVCNRILHEQNFLMTGLFNGKINNRNKCIDK